MGFRVLVLNLALLLTAISWTAGPAHAAGELGGGVQDTGPLPGRHGGTGVTSGPSQSSGAANASQPSGLTAPMAQFAPWSNEALYQSCGQSCYLKHANETLMVQASYVFYRLQGVQQLWKVGRYHRLIEETQRYCPDRNANSSTQSQAKACLTEYIHEQIPVLRSIKTALAENLNNAAAYLPEVVSVDSAGNIQKRAITSSFAVQSSVPPTPQLPQNPYAMSAKDLTAAKVALEQQSQAQDYFASETYNEWYNKSRPVEPNRSDFIKWKTGPIDPGNPTSDYVSSAQMGSDGKPVIDQGAYNAAKRRYKAEMARFQKLAGTYGNKLSPMNEPPSKRAIKAYNDAYQNFAQQANSPSSLEQGVGVMSFGSRTPAGTGQGNSAVPTLQQQENTIVLPPETVDGLIDQENQFLSKLK